MISQRGLNFISGLYISCRYLLSYYYHMAGNMPNCEGGTEITGMAENKLVRGGFA